MPTYATPGVYFETVDPATTGLGPVRTDIAGFAGYAERGPLHQPVRLLSWRQFQTEFGNPLPFGYLADAVQAFFANGGTTCYVVRVANASAAARAQVRLKAAAANAWQLTAAGEGAWGNNLALTVRMAGSGVAQTVPNFDPQPIRTQTGVNSLSGFEVGSLVRLQQGSVVRYAVVARVDALRTRLEWDGALPPELNLAQPINLETVEFSLLVFEAGQVSERYPLLSVVPGHRLYAPDVLAAASRLVRMSPETAPGAPYVDWLPAPAELVGFSGGREGLQSATVDDLLGMDGDASPRGMSALDRVSEVAILACPDLMARPVQPPRSKKAGRPPGSGCLAPLPQQMGGLSGKVTDALTGDPVPGVTVSAAGAGEVSTGPLGLFSFALDTVPAGNVEVVLARERYVERTLTAVVRANEVTELTDVDADGNPLGALQIVPLEQPPAWDGEQIYDAQLRLIGQCERLRDRVAILDMPPVRDDGAPFGLSEIQTWRARFDSAFAALYVPWLRVRTPGAALQVGAGSAAVRSVPPSGYVAGVYARTDQRDGVHRAPANEPLAGVEDVTLDLDDIQHGLLNDQDVNVIRSFRGRGIRIYGARSASSDTAWRFINVRRLVSMIEQALIRDTQWTIFESHTANLRRGLSLTVFAFLEALWQAGALAGDTRDAAFALRCDEVNNPPDSIAAGRLVCDIAVAPAVPFEFIVFRLGRSLEAVEITER